jgi:chloramphenicol-sensitive protein RarD
MTTPTDARRGLWIAIASFLLWGVMPLYWHALKVVPSLQIVMHRIVWSTVFVAGYLTWQQRDWLRAALSRPRVAWMLALSGVLIAFNWGLYIWAVNAGHVVESSLGYFINPLVSVLFGVLFLRERLTRVQWVSVALATLGVLWLTVQYGRPPWIALGLALSFALYGLIRKLAAVDAIAGLGIESVYLFAPALATLLWSEAHGHGGFLPMHGAAGWGVALDSMLVFGGALTALPLIGFAYAVRRAPLSVVGLLHYISPTLQFLIGVLLLGEAFDRDRAVGFVFIWIALALFAGEGLWRTQRRGALAAG